MFFNKHRPLNKNSNKNAHPLPKQTKTGSCAMDTGNDVGIGLARGASQGWDVVYHAIAYEYLTNVFSTFDLIAQ
jgi:hypothetical protein